MFGFFKSGKKLFSGDKAASQIVGFFMPSLVLLRQPDGSIDPRLMSDDFVLGYIWGGTAVCLEALRVSDTEEKGFAIQQLFERLFPKNGRAVTEMCNRKYAQKDAEFVRAVRLGLTELTEVLNSDGQHVANGLLDHVSKNYF